MTPEIFLAGPVNSMRFFGVLAERQLRLANVLTRAAMRPNPWLPGFALLPELETIAAPKTAKKAGSKKPEAAKDSKASTRKAYRQPSEPPSMPV